MAVHIQNLEDDLFSTVRAKYEPQKLIRALGQLYAYEGKLKRESFVKEVQIAYNYPMAYCLLSSDI